MPNKIKLPFPFLEIHITNVCNLNCTGCDTLSNYQFHGDHGLWKDWETVYKNWANIIDVKQLKIIGGEPLSHPDIINWIKGIRKLWPHTPIRIVTNGTMLASKSSHLKELYSVCKDHKIALEVNSHNKNKNQELREKVYNWLHAPLYITMSEGAVLNKAKIIEHCIKQYNIIKADHWPDCTSLEEWAVLDDIYKKECKEIHNFTFDIINGKDSQIEFSQCVTDTNGVFVDFNSSTTFEQNMLIAGANKHTFSLNNSDPNKSHDICHLKTCHQLYKGKMYKCSFIHSVPEFSEQFNLYMTDHQKNILDSYKPAEPTWPLEKIQDFVDQLDQPVGPCAFCPEESQSLEVSADTKKIFYMKKKKEQKSIIE